MLQWNFLTETAGEGDLILDCRSEAQHDESTIRGASGAAFIKKPFGSGPQSQAKFSGYIGEVLRMIEEKKPAQVVVFDEGVGMYASRMAWTLIAAGYQDVKILDRKFSEIDSSLLGKGQGQIDAEPVKTPINFNGYVSINYLQENLTRVQILDVRTPEEYAGRIPRMQNPEPGSVCGRIPGSLNWDWRSLYTREGRLKDRAEIMYDIRKIGIIQERPTIIYDFNGARSATTALILSRCGYRQITIYPGSWMEWRKTRLPKQNMQIWNG